MKLLQTSNIYLGKSFGQACSAGDKLRAGIKSVFSRIIDLAKNEAVDLVLLPGDIFDNLDVSQNLLDFFTSEIERLEQIPAVIIPGHNDGYEKTSFWDQWKIQPSSKNLHILAGPLPSSTEISIISAEISFIPSDGAGAIENLLRDDKTAPKPEFKIAMINTGNLESDGLSEIPPQIMKDLASGGFDYIALGGNNRFRDFTPDGLKAAFAGSPVVLSPEINGPGQVLIVDLEKNSITVRPIETESFQWKKTNIGMETVADLSDLKEKILQLAGQDTICTVTLSGLMLLDTGFNLNQLKSELEENFFDLKFEDKTTVLPDNISEVKVQEKTILGQYLKVMVNRLNSSDENTRADLEESLKIGYSLLSGREVL